MFGFGLLKKSTPRGERSRYVGIDLSSTRMRAIAAGDGRTRALALDGDFEDLPMTVTLDRRTAEVGRTALDMLRKSPHSVCSNYLALVGRTHEWRGPKLTLKPETAVQLSLDKIQPAVVAESDAAGLALPSYLSTIQVQKINELASVAKLPIRGTVSAALAIAAHRAAFVLAPKNQPIQATTDDEDPTAVVPLRDGTPGSGAVLLIDVDDYALNASVLLVTPAEVRIHATGLWPHASLRVWKDRLIDSISDRCVRLCRRDPRDNGESEQLLYEDLESVLDAARQRQTSRISVRAAHWYQDLQLTPEDVETWTQPILNIALDQLRQFLQASALPATPRAVWLSHTAGRLPGLAAKMFKHSPEHTTISILPVNAAAEAAASLIPRWLTGTMPRGHLDSSIPLERAVPTSSARPSATIGKPRK